MQVEDHRPLVGGVDALDILLDQARPWGDDLVHQPHHLLQGVFDVGGVEEVAVGEGHVIPKVEDHPLAALLELPRGADVALDSRAAGVPQEVVVKMGARHQVHGGCDHLNIKAGGVPEHDSAQHAPLLRRLAVDFRERRDGSGRPLPDAAGGDEQTHDGYESSDAKAVQMGMQIHDQMASRILFCK